jgi:hypothetical protein
VLGSVEIHEIVGGPRVHESGDLSTFDDGIKLHGVPHAGQMPVSTWMEIMGVSVSSIGVSSSSVTSIQNCCLHTTLCPFVKNSLQWKRCPSLWCWATSVGVSCLMDDVGVATDGEEAVEAAGTAPVVELGGLVQGCHEEC